MYKGYILSLFFLIASCSAMQNEVTPVSDASDTELGIPHISRTLSQYNLTHEDVQKLQKMAETSWTRKRALTMITLIGTAASIATTVVLRFYGNETC